MPEYAHETREWLEKAKRFEKPYGFSYRNGTLLLSVVRNEDRSIREEIAASGMSHWRAVDEHRARQLKMSAKLLRGRATWDGSEPAVRGDEYLVKLFIPQPHPEAPLYPQNDESGRLIVVGLGEEVVATSCGASRSHLQSSFFAYPQKGDDQMVKHDWLLAIAEGVEAIPGAKFLLGPLIRLRDEEKAEERNERLDRMFAENEVVSRETLSAILDLRDQRAEVLAFSQLATFALEAAFKRTRGEPVPQLPVSEFPLPVEKGLIIQELRTLWPAHRDEIRTCLREHDYQEIEQELPSNFVIEFVDSMPGNSKAKLAAVFSCLSAKRPASKILAFAAGFLETSRDSKFDFEGSTKPPTHGSG